MSEASDDMRIMDDLMRTFARPDSDSVGLSIIFAEIGLLPFKTIEKNRVDFEIFAKFA